MGIDFISEPVKIFTVRLKLSALQRHVEPDVLRD